MSVSEEVLAPVNEFEVPSVVAVLLTVCTVVMRSPWLESVWCMTAVEVITSCLEESPVIVLSDPV